MNEFMSDTYPFMNDSLQGAKEAAREQQLRENGPAIVSLTVEPPTQEMLDAHRKIYDSILPDVPGNRGTRLSRVLSHFRRPDISK